MTARYGSATIIRANNGDKVVTQADDRIGVSRELLNVLMHSAEHQRGSLLVLDTAGEYGYRQVDADGDIKIFERVR